jgi:predicted PurR-regulated permease PerM
MTALKELNNDPAPNPAENQSPKTVASANPILERHPYLCGYAFVTALIVLIFATKLTTFALSFLFLYLISDFLTNDVRKAARFLPKALLFSILYIAVLAIFVVLFWKTIPDFIKRIPDLAARWQDQAITQFEAANQRWNLTDYVNPEEVRAAIVSSTTKSISFFVREFSSFYKGFISFLFALIVNLLLYHNIKKIDDVFDRGRGTLMSFFYRFAMTRARTFYFYFKRVMLGQVVIACINALISATVIFGLGLPQPFLLVVIVLIFGVFPIVGNLASNTILTVTAFLSVGLGAAAVCLILLVLVHKLEYFLNSKIIGDMVHLPMTITLTSLIVCEILLGIAGLILAIPLVLHLRHELEHIPGEPSSASIFK